jgi:hypothetical protein
VVRLRWTACATFANPFLTPPALRSDDASNKSRIRWTYELHQRFEAAVSALGGLEYATPKVCLFLCLCHLALAPAFHLRRIDTARSRCSGTLQSVLQHMQVEGLTIQHVKSHLQKIRLQQQQQQAGGGSHMHGAGAAPRVTAPRSAAHRGIGQQPRGGRPLEEMDPVTGALANQLLLQQELFEHLNAQRQLQAALESHAAQLNALVAAQATNRDPSNAAVAAAAATAQAAATATACALSLQHQQQMAAATGDGGGMLHPRPLVMSPFTSGRPVGGGGIDPSGGLPPLFPAGLGLSASPPTLGGATHGAWGFGADM